MLEVHAPFSYCKVLKGFESKYGLVRKFCQNKYFSISLLLYAYNILYKILVHTHYGFWPKEKLGVTDYPAEISSDETHYEPCLKN